MIDKDARVAEIIEPKPIIDWSEGKERGELVSYLSGKVAFSNSKAWQLVFIYEHGDKPEWEPRTFISAPTHATDGIVLDYVQERSLPMFSMRLKKIYHQRLPFLIVDELDWDDANWMYFHLMYYKPGDYAKTLLEVNDNDK